MQCWRWQAVAGRAPGGTELFLHSKASPSRPGERRQLTAAATAHSPADDTSIAPTAAGRPFTFPSTASKWPC